MKICLLKLKKIKGRVNIDIFITGNIRINNTIVNIDIFIIVNNIGSNISIHDINIINIKINKNTGPNGPTGRRYGPWARCYGPCGAGTGRWGRPSGVTRWL